MILYMLMKRTALFLKEQQLEKLQTLTRKTGAPIAELVRRAIDALSAVKEERAEVTKRIAIYARVSTAD
jgi:Ribbon-helix-helix domain